MAKGDWAVWLVREIPLVCFLIMAMALVISAVLTVMGMILHIIKWPLDALNDKICDVHDNIVRFIRYIAEIGKGGCE